MPFFKKKQKQEPQTTQPEGVSSEDQYAPLPPSTDNTSNNDRMTSFSSSSNTINPQLVAKIEKLSAEVEAGAEIRSVYDERFGRIEGQLGELREMIVDREKDIEELEVKAVKASDLVSEVQPEKILSEVKKNDIRIDSVKAKLDSFESMNETLMDELKKIRQTVEVFRGTEEIVELNKEVRQEIFGIQKIKADIERHADKVESMYGETAKKFDDFKKYKDEAKNLEEQFSGFEKQFGELKRRVTDQVSREDFIKLSNELEARSTELTQKITQINSALQKAQELEQLTQKANILLTNIASGQIATGQNNSSGFDQSAVLSLNLQLDNMNKLKNDFRASKFEIELLKGEISELKKTKTGPQISLFGKTGTKTESITDTSDFVKKEELKELLQKINNQKNHAPQTSTQNPQISADYIKKAEMDEIIKNMNQRIEFVAQQKISSIPISQKNEIPSDVLNQVQQIRDEIDSQKTDILTYLADVKKGQQSQSERHAQLTMLFEFQTNKLKSLTDKSKRLEDDLRHVADSLGSISTYRKEQSLTDEKEQSLSERLNSQAQTIAELKEDHQRLINELNAQINSTQLNTQKQSESDKEKDKTILQQLVVQSKNIQDLKDKHVNLTRQWDELNNKLILIQTQEANELEALKQTDKAILEKLDSQAQNLSERFLLQLQTMSELKTNQSRFTKELQGLNTQINITQSMQANQSEFLKQKDQEVTEKISSQAKNLSELNREYMTIRSELKELNHHIKKNDLESLNKNYDKLKSDIDELIPVIQNIGNNRNDIEKIKDGLRVMIRQFSSQKQRMEEEIQGLRHKLRTFEDVKEKLELNIYEVTKDLEKVKIETKSLNHKIGDTNDKQLLLQYFTEKTKELEHKFRAFEHSMHKTVSEQLSQKSSTSSSDIESLKNKITDDLEIRENINIRIGNLEKKYSTLSEILSKLVVLINQLSEKEN